MFLTKAQQNRRQEIAENAPKLKLITLGAGALSALMAIINWKRWYIYSPMIMLTYASYEAYQLVNNFENIFKSRSTEAQVKYSNTQAINYFTKNALVAKHILSAFCHDLHIRFSNV